MPFGPPTTGRPTSEAKTLLIVFILKVIFPAKRKFPFGIYTLAPPDVVNPGNTLLTFKMDIVPFRSNTTSERDLKGKFVKFHD